MKKLWFVFCILFCAYSLSNLLKERYDVTYFLENQTSPTHFACCRELKEFYPSETTIDLTRLKDELYKFLNSSEEDDDDGKTTVLELTRSGSFYIRNDLICWILKQNDYVSVNDVWEFQGSEAILLVFDEDTLDFVLLNDPFDNYDQIVVLNRERPFSNCIANYSKFRCLNECFKSRFRLAKYYYDGNETGLLYLNQAWNKTLEEHEERCFGKCERDSCKITNIITNKKPQLDYRIHTFKAHRMLSEFDYWAQLIGLICLFFNLSFCKLLLLSFERIDLQVRTDRTRRYLVYLKFVILSIGLIALCSAFVQMTLDYEDRKKHPIRKATFMNLIQPDEKIELAICVSIQLILSYDAHLQASYFYNTTLFEYEMKTESGLDYALEKIELDYQNQTIPLNYTRKKQVLFRFHGSKHMRCFPITVHLAKHVPRYQSLLSITKLKIKFKIIPGDYQLFLLTDGETFEVNSFMVSGSLAFRKNITERSKVRCVEVYRELYGQLKCTSRSGCVVNCAQRKFIETHHNVLIGSALQSTVIDKNLFNDSEWRTAFLVKEDETLEKLLKQCEEEIAETNCTQTKFENSFGMRQPDFKTKELDLFHEVFRSVEEQPSSYKLLLDILALQSIFFGCPVFKLVRMLLRVVTVRLRIEANKLALLPIYILCSAGFAYQVYQVLDVIINPIHISQSQHYALLKTIKMPLVIFCFSYNPSLIDKNHKLTGSYLERLTREMDAKTFFNNISYLDESNVWRQLDRESIKFFFFVDKKCFILESPVQEYRSKQFHFANERHVLRADFNRNLLGEKERFVYFMTQTSHTMQFSKISSFSYGYPSNFNDYSNEFVDKFLITQELFLARRLDKFFFVRNPLSSFRGQSDLNDIEGYLGNLLSSYREAHQLVTLNMPIWSSLFDVEIEDELFGQYFTQIQNKSDHEKPSNLDYRREFAINYLTQFENYKCDFQFSLSMFQKVIIETNPDTFAKLVLNLLSVLSIWFDLTVLDLWVLARKTKHLFLFIHRLLVRLKRVLRRSMLSLRF